MILDNLKLKTKSMLPLALMAALFAGVVAMSATTISDVSSRYARLMTQNEPCRHLCSTLQSRDGPDGG